MTSSTQTFSAELDAHRMFSSVVTAVIGVVAPPTVSFPGPGQDQLPGSAWLLRAGSRALGRADEGPCRFLAPLAAACAGTGRGLGISCSFLRFHFGSWLRHHSVAPLQLCLSWVSPCIKKILKCIFYDCIGIKRNII